MIATLPQHWKRTLRNWRNEAYIVAADDAALLIAADPPSAGYALNDAQTAAVEAIAAAGAFVPFLLHGVTGSGKTDVYLAAAARVLAQGRQVLMLVPEINLTPQLFARVRAAAPGLRVATLHSGLPPGERRAEWLAAASGAAQLVLGTRLAVFAPLPALGLVIVDEEQDASYKQQDNVRYHARDAAIWRAQRRAVPVVLGSATPSLESWLHAREERYRRLDLPQRADPRAALPPVVLTGNRAARSLDGIGETLRSAIAARLVRREQSLIFVNRRGVRARRSSVPHASGKPIARDAARASPRIASPRRCDVIIADMSSVCPRHAPRAGTSTSFRSASVRSVLHGRWPRRFPPRASPASIATARGRETPSSTCATR
jgi:primosomal protein N' (replication factor Y)